MQLEDLDIPGKRARTRSKGGDIDWLFFGSGSARLLPRLIAGRRAGPVFLSSLGPSPARAPAAGDICPQTDITVVVSGTPRPHHPASAELVVEVAWSSVRIDRHAKARVYGAAGIPEYWVVDLVARRLVCHRDPAPDGYRSVSEFDETATLTPLVLPNATLVVGELLNASYDF